VLQGSQVTHPDRQTNNSISGLDTGDRKLALILQPWGGEAGVKLVEQCAEEYGLSCEMIQEFLPFDWNNIFSKIVRWYGPSVRTAIKGIKRRTGKDVILACDPMCGLIFAAIARTFRLKLPPMVISMFLLRPWKYRFMDQLRSIFANYGLARVGTIICFSSYEVDRYRKEFPRHADKIVFVPVGCDPTILDLDVEKQRVDSKPPEPYIFSGGTTNRDYGTLVRAMSLLPGLKLKIIAKKKDYPGSLDGMEFLENVYGADYERAVYDATIVALSLYDQCFSSGQLTLLRAMELGKAVVASDVPGMRDYITSGQDGVLVPPGDAEAMSAAINELMVDSDKRQELGRRARETHQSRFTQKMSVCAIVSYAARAVSK
jgi:glycosyltransferase involved in cell wall biosynthesis